ncbi:gliding motility-associated C-terminal domain-containing protein, partial [Arenibacter sp. GZD96]|uniref:gliding motility-associated C-terminal domain-containing protein n=1 Tax=Aurantibrevibacter litoralis TaxID=3106030 RepID=UPI002AFF47A3
VGEAVGCTEHSFTTETIATIPDCTVLIAPLNGATEVPVDTDIAWETVPNADGYRVSIGTTPGGVTILNNEDVGFLTSYSVLNEFPFSSTIYVTVVPYNVHGSAENCIEGSFTTIAEPLVESEYGFSPNGDGINDFWEIKGIENSPQNIVTIYNRWGDMVFSLANYDNLNNVFRGEANKLNGFGADTLPNGTYFFDIQISGTHNLKKLKGFVVIRR